jgi:hypothetical protein
MCSEAYWRKNDIYIQSSLRSGVGMAIGIGWKELVGGPIGLKSQVRISLLTWCCNGARWSVWGDGWIIIIIIT